MTKIDFNRVQFNPIKVEVEVLDILFDGKVVKEKNNLLILNGKLSGLTESICDRCGDDFGLKIDEEIFLKLVNGAISLQEEEDLDIIECDGVINFDDILFGEIESIKLDYNYCKRCKK